MPEGAAPEQATRLQTAFEEADDSIIVLNEGAILPAAVTELTQARNLIAQAQVTDPSGTTAGADSAGKHRVGTGEKRVAVTP
jgi:hypothetical protein